MADDKYLTSPPKITTMPPGVPYIIGNEAAERFSYYGMNGILTIFMSKYLMDKMGNLAVMPPHQAEAWYHTFVSTLYILPIIGAFLADALFGKFWVVFWLSIVYCGGHATLACFYKCWRPIWRIEQAFADPSLQLVLLFN